MRRLLLSLILLNLSVSPGDTGTEVSMDYSSQRYIGGLGGVYLLAEAGPLAIEVLKRDRHDGDRDTALRVILLGPDRRPLAEATIKGDGRARLETVVERKGIYVVNVTAAFDRYGEAVWWGFRTNCRRFLIETSRGHKDARHVEPIVVGDPLDGEQDEPFHICFLPAAGPIEVQVSGRQVSGAAAGEAPRLLSAEGERIAAFDGGGGDGKLTVTSEKRTAPWQLQLPGSAEEVLIDGVTQWERGDRLENLSLWTVAPERFFAFHDLRWALTPYRMTFPAAPGESRFVQLRVHNNGDAADTLTLAAEPGRLGLTVEPSRVELAAGESATVRVTADVPGDVSPGDTLRSRVAVTSTRHRQIETWSTIEARVQDAEPAAPLEMPIVYRPYEHENAQFAYTPDYPVPNQPYFDTANRAVIRADDGFHRWSGAQWEWIDTVPGTRFRAGGSKVAFGGDGELCLLAQGPQGPAYLVSADDGATFVAHVSPRPGAPTQADIEQFAGHNRPVGPAPFIVATQTSGADAANFWRRVNDLVLHLPTFTDGVLDVGEPIRVSDRAIGISSHSGIPSAIASYGDRVHVIWGEATDPDVDVPGVPAYVATYDRTQGRWLGEPALVGYGPPANDVHNTPSLVIDSKGFLHTLTGTHGQPFVYARSLEPNTAHAGFTEPALVEQDLRSTYVGLVCDPDDTLHLVFRAWRSDGVHHPRSHYAILGYKRKPADGDWEPTRLLAVAPFSEYSIWYHRLTIDRRGRLFVSFDSWSTFWFYRNDHVGTRRKTIWSDDGGDSWYLLHSGQLSVR